MKITHKVDDSYSALSLLLKIYGTLSSIEFTPNEIKFIISVTTLPAKYKANPLSTQGRKKLCEINGWTVTYLNNLIYSLLKKNFITKDEDNFYYFPTFISKAAHSYEQNKQLDIAIFLNEKALL